jgi:hypothetical protein
MEPFENELPGTIFAGAGAVMIGFPPHSLKPSQ